MPNPKTNNLEWKLKHLVKEFWFEMPDKSLVKEEIILKEDVLQFISDLLKKEAPYSVSEWMKVGKERGYFDYFKEEIRKKDMEELIKMLPDEQVEENIFKVNKVKQLIKDYYNKRH